MSRKTEVLRLNKIAIKSGGYVVTLCPECRWWRFEAGDKVKMEQDYCEDIRCKCRKGARE